MTVEDLYLQIMLNSGMREIPIGYQSKCLSVIKETLSSNGISMEREVSIELSESVSDESISDTTELYESATYDELYR